MLRPLRLSTLSGSGRDSVLKKKKVKKTYISFLQIKKSFAPLQSRFGKSDKSKQKSTSRETFLGLSVVNQKLFKAVQFFSTQ